MWGAKREFWGKELPKNCDWAGKKTNLKNYQFCGVLQKAKKKKYLRI